MRREASLPLPNAWGMGPQPWPRLLSLLPPMRFWGLGPPCLRLQPPLPPLLALATGPAYLADRTHLALRPRRALQVPSTLHNFLPWHGARDQQRTSTPLGLSTVFLEANHGRCQHKANHSDPTPPPTPTPTTASPTTPTTPLPTTAWGLGPHPRRLRSPLLTPLTLEGMGPHHFSQRPPLPLLLAWVTGPDYPADGNCMTTCRRRIHAQQRLRHANDLTHSQPTPKPRPKPSQPAANDQTYRQTTAKPAAVALTNRRETEEATHKTDPTTEIRRPTRPTSPLPRTPPMTLDPAAMQSRDPQDGTCPRASMSSPWPPGMRTPSSKPQAPRSENESSLLLSASSDAT
jgi:hypothetical protein